MTITEELMGKRRGCGGEMGRINSKTPEQTKTSNKERKSNLIADISDLTE